MLIQIGEEKIELVPTTIDLAKEGLPIPATKTSSIPTTHRIKAPDATPHG